jgi:hypothetical protein
MFKFYLVIGSPTPAYAMHIAEGFAFAVGNFGG